MCQCPCGNSKGRPCYEDSVAGEGGVENAPSGSTLFEYEDKSGSILWYD